MLSYWKQRTVAVIGPLSKLILRYIFIFAFSGAVAVVLLQFPLEKFEYATLDGRIRLSPTPAADDSIRLVAVDFKTVNELGRKWTLSDQTRLLEKLRLARARLVISLLQPQELQHSDADIADLQSELRFWPNEPRSGFAIALDSVALKGDKDALKLMPPFDSVRTVSFPVSTDKNIFARDGVTRRMLLSYQGLLTFPATLGTTPQRGEFEFLGSQQAFIRYSRPRTYAHLSASDVLKGINPQSDLTDKTVLIGMDLQTEAKDYVRTPHSRDIIGMTLLEHHANMIATIRRNDSPVRAPDWVNWGATVGFAFLTAMLVLNLRPLKGVIYLLATTIGFLGLAWALFAANGLWIGVVHPLLAAFTGYYFFIPYRLIQEGKRTWELQQKNQILTEVEELKTNFLSMVSHDLKTPIARIQGMASILGENTENWSTKQKDALESVSRSAKELLDFVTSILDLGRIEANAIQLQLTSRDLNTLIQECVERLRPLAEAKNIELRLELETLFSLKMDVGLIRQVIGNLIENAIKYSPKGTAVLISTEESEDGFVLLQVADQGRGIPAEETDYIFSKFYRSKDVKSSPIKGSGLGLYLAKYFIELHGGAISVESEVGIGSTFSVRLPMAP